MIADIAQSARWVGNAVAIVTIYPRVAVVVQAVGTIGFAEWGRAAVIRAIAWILGHLTASVAATVADWFVHTPVDRIAGVRRTRVGVVAV